MKVIQLMWQSIQNLNIPPPSPKQPPGHLSLNSEEIYWLNDYHKKVFENLERDISPEIRTWLKNECKKI